MHDIIDQGLTYLRSIWQYRWSAIIAAWVIAIAGWMWVYNLPDQYKASTRVYIDSDSVLRPLLKGLAVETDIEQQLKLMTRTLLSRPNIEKIMRMTDLDIRVSIAAEKEKMISRLTREIQIRKMGRERGINLYQITYMDKERDLAKQVVQALLTILIEGSLGNTREDSDSAKEFLAVQIKEYETRLISAEDRLTNFKQKNVGVLPNHGGGYYSNLQKFKDNRDQAMLDLREGKNRRDSIKQQLASLIETGGFSMPEENRMNSPLETRILTLQTKLDEMMLKYTEHHPSVHELKVTIAGLEEQKNAENQPQADDNEAGLKAHPFYQELQLALAIEEANVAALNSRENEYGSRIQKLKKQIKILPRIEADLKRLDRDYAINKKNYDALITRRESAYLAARADMAGDSIKFRVIDPPWVPESASEPKRLLYNSIVLLAALGGGIGLAFLISLVRPVYYSSKVLHEITGVEVWGDVSMILTDQQVATKKRQIIMVTTIIFMLVILYAAVMAYELKQQGLLNAVISLI